MRERPEHAHAVLAKFVAVRNTIEAGPPTTEAKTNLREIIDQLQAIVFVAPEDLYTIKRQCQAILARKGES